MVSYGGYKPFRTRLTLHRVLTITMVTNQLQVMGWSSQVHPWKPTTGTLKISLSQNTRVWRSCRGSKAESSIPKGESSNHHFARAMLNFQGVDVYNPKIPGDYELFFNGRLDLQGLSLGKGKFIYQPWLVLNDPFAQTSEILSGKARSSLKDWWSSSQQINFEIQKPLALWLVNLPPP